MSVARTTDGREGSLLIDDTGALVTSASLLLGEMRMFLIPPERYGWVPLDGSDVDARRYPRLAKGLGKEKKLPKIDHMWVYAG